MDIDDLVPAGGGSLRRSVLHGGRALATFTQVPLNHDETWQASTGLNSEFHTARGAFDSQQEEEKPGQPGDAFDFRTTARTIRSALRPGA
jgi:hypothetical protein